MTQAVIEWANVTNDTLIIARDAGEVWFRTIYATDNESFPFAKCMTSSGAPGSTVGLLDGAISLGFRPTRDHPGEHAPNLVRYIYSLVGGYYTSKDTPRNLLRAADRFKEIGRMEVAAYLETRAREETVTTGSRLRICPLWVCRLRKLWPILFRLALTRSAIYLITFHIKNIQLTALAFLIARNALRR
jgi:hypothetical protein